MQNSSIVTRCPQCQTAFRVNPAQLNVAKGAVRCGSCLHIFRALDHADTKPASKTTTSNQPKAATNPAKKVAQKQPPKPAQPDSKRFSFDVDDELVQDNDSIDNAVNQDDDDFYFYDKETPSANKNSSIFGATASAKPITKTTQEKADESWALDILAELEEEEDEIPDFKLPESKKRNHVEKKPQSPASDSSRENRDNIVPLHKKTKPITAIEQPTSKKASTPFESTIDDDVFIDTQSFEEQAQQEVERLHTHSESSEDLEFYFDEDFEANTDSHSPNKIDEPPYDTVDENLESLISDDEIDYAMQSSPSYKDELQGMIKGIQSAPVEMGAYESEERRKWLWRFAILIGALLLIAQTLYFRFDSLSKNPSYRPLMTQVCNVMGCKVPELVNLEQIRSNNLIVRNHPTAANALLVDVILINNANFEQPYPALSLEFSSLDNTLLAASEIQPRQYLRGELAGSQLMPAKQPIQVSLSIEDPGADALNYRLTIIPNNNPPTK